MNLQGKLLEIMQEKTLKSNFRKREFIVEYASNPQFPQFVKFELTNDNCSKIDNFSVGDFIDIEFDIRGTKWVNPKSETVYFTSLVPFRIKKAEGSSGDSFDDIPPEDFGSVPEQPF